ncbi:MAG: hypothetical protein LBL17_02140 [Coxiellaceae bacterium]|jgi:hypothetical protein|nr:hypothetical protein [Coxiellaceae bacterium]
MQIFFLILGLLVVSTTFAVCPICTIAVGAGVGLAQYLSIDDVISGLWIGGIIVSLIMLTKTICDKKNFQFHGYTIVITILYYIIIIVPLYFSGIIGHDLNKWCGIDKIVLGIVIGSGTFLLGTVSYKQLKKRNNNKVYFPFQKVVMPIAPLIILSILFYVITKLCP